MAIGNKLHILRKAAAIWVFKDKCAVCNESLGSSYSTLVRKRFVYPVHTPCKVLFSLRRTVSEVDADSKAEKAERIATRMIKGGRPNVGILKIAKQIYDSSATYQNRVPQSLVEKFQD